MAGACDGKVALVTGASRGLGKAIAQRLAGEGATVGLTARTLEPDPKYHGSLRQTLDEITTAGGKAHAIQADLSKSEERERLFGELVEKCGAPDILVNNAAVTFLRPLDEFPERRTRLMIEMHVLAPMHLSQLAIPAMRARGRYRPWISQPTILQSPARISTRLPTRASAPRCCSRSPMTGAGCSRSRTRTWKRTVCFHRCRSATTV